MGVGPVLVVNKIERMYKTSLGAGKGKWAWDSPLGQKFCKMSITESMNVLFDCRCPHGVFGPCKFRHWCPDQHIHTFNNASLAELPRILGRAEVPRICFTKTFSHSESPQRFKARLP